ncbi:hypothetical protein SE17_12685 [Kouleothrix aurantiaca]|jgi:hypothetical protein|uniref:Uncharacterized protein n=1 Tax=Kouleothrix aurantiaca TaxID=186479 RepID=A0A0P9DRS6_9CHLR|nr:hypothetical protein SE17_12685 [Kouleothrix aurantiaca]
MVGFVVQVAIIAIWAAMLVIHTRRLLRLANIELKNRTARPIRPQLHRVWWWLGREEYWRAVQVDVLRGMQMTFMMFLLVWGIYA